MVCVHSSCTLHVNAYTHRFHFSFFCLSSGAYGAKKAAGGKVPYGMYTCLPTLPRFSLVISLENMKNIDNDKSSSSSKGCNQALDLVWAHRH